MRLTDEYDNLEVTNDTEALVMALTKLIDSINKISQEIK